MMVNKARNAEEIAGDIRHQLGNSLDDVKISLNRVIVAHYIRKKLSQNIIAAPVTHKEDRFQGKVGLVLAMGSMAFKNDASHDFKGFQPKVGDWIVYRHSDGTDFDITPLGTFDRIECRQLMDDQVAMIIPHPDLVY